MKNKFKHYHKFTKEELIQLSKESLFILDTNILLNLYRYSRPTVDNYFSVLTKLKEENRIWIPYHVALEFYENRINVISEQNKSYQEILKTISKFKTDFFDKYKTHPFLNFEEIFSSLDKNVISEIEKNIKETEKLQPNWIEQDEILDKINFIFQDNVGEILTEQRINEIKVEGKQRYENKIPPGYRDSKKPDEKKFGDLIIWFEIIEKAIESKKNIILVSADTKEDWWLEKDGQKIMPLPSLKKEIYEKAGVEFHIYTPASFLEFSTIKNQEMDTSISEARKFQEIDEQSEINQKHNFKIQSTALNLSNPFLSDKLKFLISEIENKILRQIQGFNPYDPINDISNYRNYIRKLRIITLNTKLLKDENFNDISNLNLFISLLDDLIIFLSELISSAKLDNVKMHELHNLIASIEMNKNYISNLI